MVTANDPPLQQEQPEGLSHPWGRSRARQTEMLQWLSMRHGWSLGKHVALTAPPEGTRPLRNNHPSVDSQAHQTYSGHFPFHEKQVYFFFSFRTQGKWKNAKVPIPFSRCHQAWKGKHSDYTHTHTEACTHLKKNPLILLLSLTTEMKESLGGVTVLVNSILKENSFKLERWPNG